MARGQIGQNFLKLLRFMARFPLLKHCQKVHPSLAVTVLSTFKHWHSKSIRTMAVSILARLSCPRCLRFLALEPKQIMQNHVKFRKAPDTFNFLRHVMRAIWSVRPKCSHRCVSLTETSLKPVKTLKLTTKNSAEQTAMRTKWFKRIAI